MWSSFLPALAVYLSLSAASPVPQSPTRASLQSPTIASTQAPTQASIHAPTQTPSQAPTVQATQANPSGLAATSRYLVTHVEISQHQGDVIPSHNTTATIIQTIEKFDIVVQGTNAGAVPVQCNATWIATMATPTSDPVGTQFSCSDPAVSALMLRQDSDPSIGWWIMVELKYVTSLCTLRLMSSRFH